MRKEIKRSGMNIIIGNTKPKRDAYVRTYVQITDPSVFSGDVQAAWMAAVDEVYGIFGAMPTEDNTVGQIAQTRHGLKEGTTFELSCNLWGRKIRPIHARIAAAV
jgi:hypothetical protein